MSLTHQLHSPEPIPSCTVRQALFWASVQLTWTHNQEWLRQWSPHVQVIKPNKCVKGCPTRSGHSQKFSCGCTPGDLILQALQELQTTTLNHHPLWHAKASQSSPCVRRGPRYNMLVTLPKSISPVQMDAWGSYRTEWIKKPFTPLQEALGDISSTGWLKED